VYFTHRVFDADNPVFVRAVAGQEPGRRHRLFVVVDDGVAGAWPTLCTAIERYCEVHAQSLELVAPPKPITSGAIGPLIRVPAPSATHSSSGWSQPGAPASPRGPCGPGLPWTPCAPALPCGPGLPGRPALPALPRGPGRPRFPGAPRRAGRAVFLLAARVFFTPLRRRALFDRLAFVVRRDFFDRFATQVLPSRIAFAGPWKALLSCSTRARTGATYPLSSDPV